MQINGKVASMVQHTVPAAIIRNISVMIRDSILSQRHTKWITNKIRFLGLSLSPSLPIYKMSYTCVSIQNSISMSVYMCAYTTFCATDWQVEYNQLALSHIHTYIYIHTHTYMHTYIHTYIYLTQSIKTRCSVSQE